MNTGIISKIRSLSEKFSKRIISFRRHLHKHPELSFQEYRTTEFITAKLSDLNLDSIKHPYETGVVGLMKNGRGKCVALRADIDALPIEEKTGLPFSSVNSGVMHACGHDAHSAMLYGAALILNEIRQHLKGSVKFIFQPAEEKNPGGASILIKKGVLTNPEVDAIFGQHVLPGKPAGKVGFYKGVMMASQDEIYITIKGKSGHAAKPHSASDPVTISAEFISSLQTIASRNINPYEPVVISICSIHGGSATNVIPGEVHLSGTVRALNGSVRKKIHSLIEQRLKGITSAHNATYSFKISEGYPELINSVRETEFAESCAHDFFGKKNIFKGKRYMFAEDFSFYLEKVSGTFYWIGAGNTTGLHTPTINIDEKILPSGAAFMAYLAYSYLSSAKK